MDTDDAQYLTYVRCSTELDPVVRFFIGDGIHESREASIDEISAARGLVVSYELSNTACQFRRERRLIPSNLLDIVDAVKLAGGRPAAGPRDPSVSVWHLLRRHGGHGLDIAAIKTPATSRGGSADEVLTAMTSMAQGLRELWTRTRTELISHGEVDRLLSVEVPVGRLLLEMEVRGIRFDRNVLEERLGALSARVALASSNLRLNWNVLAANDPGQLARAVMEDGHAELLELIRKPLLPSLVRANLDAVLEFLPENHAVASEIKAYRAATHDKAVMLHLSAVVGDMVFPRYANMGTVTGRILVRYPALQYLSRASRHVLKPREGRVFLYADFAQFEPGILADDSGDNLLRDDYNSGDLYRRLSMHVFGSENYRDHAKLVFLSFCYGMSLPRVADMLTANTGRADEMEALARAFFSRYEALEPWRERLAEELKREGRVSTRLGNHRAKKRPGLAPSDSDYRACLSQRVQGTASLIFKRAMLRVHSAGVADAILPMHDAMLYEVDANATEEARQCIEASFCRAFEDECPSVQARVLFKQFGEVEASS